MTYHRTVAKTVNSAKSLLGSLNSCTLPSNGTVIQPPVGELCHNWYSTPCDRFRGTTGQSGKEMLYSKSMTGVFSTQSSPHKGQVKLQGTLPSIWNLHGAGEINKRQNRRNEQNKSWKKPLLLVRFIVLAPNKCIPWRFPSCRRPPLWFHWPKSSNLQWHRRSNHSDNDYLQKRPYCCNADHQNTTQRMNCWEN